MAREGYTTSCELDAEQQKAKLSQAISDLQHCLNIFDKTQPFKPKEVDDTRKALNRVERKYKQLSSPPQPSEEKREKQTASQNITNQSSSTDDHLSELVKQRQDVVRLLMSRQMGLANNENPPAGEGFFLLDWQWWSRWCKEVDFFYVQENMNDQQKQEKETAYILNMLPRGAVLPPDDDDDGDDSNSEGSDSSSRQEESLGPIDNSRLLSVDDPFHRHWYDTSSLRPNLVRGYHYELLPREVYMALKSWYGETTPSRICRRTTDHRVVTLYPPAATPATTSNQESLDDSKVKCNACRAPGAKSRCKQCMSVQYCDRQCQVSHWPFHKAMCKVMRGNGNNGQTQQLPLDAEGRVGLNNLGNTCFMNSALQCLSHATPLTRHFLSDKFKADLNVDNPLGTGGKLATAYDTVMKDLWMRSQGSAVSPTSLKRAIALFAPRFAGCLQHDAQEFLAYLLDGLHEDLNRIRKAPYVEMPDVTNGQNMAIAGAEAWDAHKRRNDSLVLDSFYGQFQSTCVCPKCNRVSVSFDAYNHVSLEIPQLNKMTVLVPVLVFRAGSHEPPCRYGVTLHRQCLVADLKAELGNLTGIDPSRLILGDIEDSTICALLNDKNPVARIRSNDILAAYETEPYANNNIHAIVAHELVGADQTGQPQQLRFGFPFMTAFGVEVTCRQIWDQLWDIVGHMVIEEGSKEGYVDRRKRYRREDILAVRFIESNHDPINLFADDKGSPTSWMPFDSDDEIRSFLGEDCAEKFLFLQLEWHNPTDLEDGEGLLVHQNLFLAFSDHKSLLDAIQEQRSQNGAKAVTLDQCFKTFTKPERLDDNNMWYCSKCKEHVRALKTMKLWRLPNILVVHLKRFEFKHALRRDKLDTFVDFPLDGLNMTRHCAASFSTSKQPPFVDAEIPAEYDLFAIVNHFGRMGFGHYTAFARRWDETGMTKDWALFDDSSVRSCSAESVVTPAAYVLFYRRRTFN